MEKRTSRRRGLESMLRSYFKYFGEDVVTACSTLTVANLVKLSREFIDYVEAGLTKEDCDDTSILYLLLNAYELDQLAEESIGQTLPEAIKRRAKSKGCQQH